MRKKWLVVYAKDMFNRCWLLNHINSQMNGKVIHRQCQRNNDPMKVAALHVCCNKYCVNPLHHAWVAGGNIGDSVSAKYRWIKKMNATNVYSNEERYKYYRPVLHPGMESLLTLVYADEVLKNYKCNDDKQIAYAKDIFNEFGRRISKKTIQLTVMEDYYNELK